MCVPGNSPVKTLGKSFTFILISMKEQEGYYIFPQIQSTFVVMSRWLNLNFVIAIITLIFMYYFIFLHCTDHVTTLWKGGHGSPLAHIFESTLHGFYSTLHHIILCWIVFVNVLLSSIISYCLISY